MILVKSLKQKLANHVGHELHLSVKSEELLNLAYQAGYDQCAKDSGSTAFVVASKKVTEDACKRFADQLDSVHDVDLDFLA